MDSNRRLRAVWTYEAAQDLLGFHNIDAAAELAAALAAEIDAEILADLRGNSPLRPYRAPRKVYDDDQKHYREGL